MLYPNCLSYFDTELSQNIQYNDDVLSVIRRSDLMKRYSSSHMNILFGIEIQSVPDKNMPIRIAGYTYLSYVILDKKDTGYHDCLICRRKEMERREDQGV